MAENEADHGGYEMNRRTLMRHGATGAAVVTGGSTLAATPAAAGHGVMTVDEGDKVESYSLPGMRHRWWSFNRYGYRVKGTVARPGTPIEMKLRDYGGRVRKSITFTPQEKTFDVTAWTYTRRIHTIEFV